MSLSHGRPYLAIPGPSVMPDRVLAAMHRPAPNIYTGALHEMTETLVPDLKAVAGTRHDVAIYIANGHGTWEASLLNVLSRGDRVLALVSGRFGEGWAEVARALGAEVEVMEFGLDRPADPARIEARLREDREAAIKAVMVVHADTATGVRSDVAAIRAAMDAAGHPALLLADCIASMGCDRFEMDRWGVDVAITASQKGLMTPPGLGFVFFSERAGAARARADMVTPYWDWRPRAAPEQYYQYFGGTAPTHHLYGLRAALDMIAEEGLEQVWTRHARLAAAVWAAVECWGRDGTMRLNVAAPEARSHAVTSIALEAPDADRLRAWCEQEAGLTLGIGLGRMPMEGWFRIGHMGHVNAHMVLGALGVIEAGLAALSIPHGAGGAAAAARALAG
ncbi:pyridoxal-phosphate-dependent aminotransferase family protein [Limimaricola pyoseonensis]|uniref:Alanine-glyoxylate transaminase / serine-glyoxylate transaminase / serine-pyruvate transaminase n=1 Tax=Limimaricola pyoseonensis TaxID=521013 RepID=A0A1G7DIG0_9RHOB|nr:aminotransferase class V-fold PLP-dependent enzyme [Limimaricola pyoseonensis]SDE50565.1 alanine-glyoxylate transaminase / serine-glyoxylate transaminase / serine-pyruvate transaminase [Limimaricola pyoseonensis]